MSEMFKIILLSVVQGIAEFLPVSSSGHLAVLGRLMDFDPEKSVLVNVILHAGTLAAILVFYFKELIALLKKDNWRIIGLIVVGTIPAVIVGLAIKKTGLDEKLFGYPLVSGIGFLITATLLIIGMKSGRDDGVELAKTSYVKALLIGIAQAIAIMPGISRSGSTISAALKLGIKKADCATFSFMLAIPVIGGAALLEILSAVKHGELTYNAAELLPLITGFIVSAVVGYVSLNILLAVLKKGRLGFFSIYLYIVGVLVIGWSIYLILK